MFTRPLLILLFGCLLLTAGTAWRTSAKQAPFRSFNSATHAAAQPTPVEKAFLYKGIAIGTLTDDVRSKLGDPKDKTDAQDLYIFNDDESAQFLYGPDHKVTAIMITFSGKLSEAPKPKDVFGEDVPAKADGGVFKMVRYPKLGYWISYNKIVGDNSIISIAMQKL